MAAFGTFTLLLALVIATYSGVASVVGARRGSLRLVESGRAAAYALAAVLGLSSVTIVYAFVSHDYAIKYVQRYSDASSPLFFQITAYWGGLDGSIMWWVFLLSAFSAIAIYTNRHRHKEILPYAVAVLMTVAVFFLFLIVFYKNPFDTFMGEAPAKGNGLNPLLQNAYMITHPPSLYTGFVGMTIPFAFAMGALISGHLDDAWIASMRRWTLIAWFFLAMGLTLGMLWAYEELGWGGFWGWDPVENAGFLPFLTATAFLHSIQIQERRGMMKVWNFSLVILTFLLTIFGTFMTRSGIVQSVHAFGEDKKLATIFVSFMAFVIVVSFGFLIARLPELRARNTLESWLSREAAFLLNNWILVFSAFFILFATMFPTISESLRGERITVGPPFFNKWMVPIGICLLFLTGVGPLIAWRKTSPDHLRYQFTYPVLAMVAALGICFATGMSSSWAATICFAFCAFTTAGIVQEFARGYGVRRKNTGSDVLTAFTGMIIRGKRRYGGYVVHMGIVCMFLGWAGQAYQLEEEVVLKPGQEKTFGGYSLRLDKLAFEEDQQKEMITGEFTVSRDGKVIDQLRPAIWYYANQNNDRTTEVAIRRSFAEDLYLTLGNYDLGEKEGNFKLVLNPLVDWIWFGFMMLAIGTGIALIPEKVLVTAAARAGAGVDTIGATDARGVATGLFLLVLGASLFAGGSAAAVDPVSEKARIAEDKRYLEKNILCMCGCRHLVGECSMGGCSSSPVEKADIHRLLDEGKSRDQVIAFFIEKYGGQGVLAAPIDKGLNRLAWALPYGLGLAGAGALAFGAWRFSRRQNSAAAAAAASPPAAPTPDDEKLQDKLQDKLEEELDRID